MPVSSKEFLDIQATIACRFALKRVHDMITYSQMHCTGKYSQLSSIIWPFWLNGWVFVYELIGCGFEYRWCHLNFQCGASFKQRVSWNSGNYWHMRMWHGNNTQVNVSDRKVLTTQFNNLASLAKRLSVHLQSQWPIQTQFRHSDFLKNRWASRWGGGEIAVSS